MPAPGRGDGLVDYAAAAAGGALLRRLPPRPAAGGGRDHPAVGPGQRWLRLVAGATQPGVALADRSSTAVGRPGQRPGRTQPGAGGASRPRGPHQHQRTGSGAPSLELDRWPRHPGVEPPRDPAGRRGNRQRERRRWALRAAVLDADRSGALAVRRARPVGPRLGIQGGEHPRFDAWLPPGDPALAGDRRGQAR